MLVVLAPTGEREGPLVQKIHYKPANLVLLEADAGLRRLLELRTVERAVQEAHLMVLERLAVFH